MSDVVLPIDIKSRGFLGKLWLANNVVLNGNRAIIGDRRSISKALPDIEPDFYLAMGAPDEKIGYFKKLKDNGVIIGIHDTEGMYSNLAGQFVDKYSRDALDFADVYFSWGSSQAKSIDEKFGSDTIKTIVSGTPRFDLLHPELNEIYGGSKHIKNISKFLLVITNFTTVNNYDPNRTKDKSDDYRKWERLSLNEYLKFITIATKKLDIPTIIRPHPAESVSPYDELALNNDNVYVKDNGSVREYLYSASAVIHSGSTVAIESNIMDVPTIEFNPEPWYQLPEEPSKASCSINSTKELVTEIGDIINNQSASGFRNPPIDESIGSRLHNSTDVKSAEIISSEIKKELQTTPERDHNHTHNYNKTSLMHKIAYNHKVSSLLYVNTDNLSKLEFLFSSTVPSISGQRFNMFSEITKHEIENYLSNMASHSDTSVRRVGNWANLFEISSSSGKGN